MKARILILALATLGLAACGDQPQTAGGTKADTAPWQGGGAASFQAQGWKAGDKNSWEQHLKTRAQQGQNDYAKVN